MVVEKIINFLTSENIQYKMIDISGEVTVDKNRAHRFLLEGYGILIVDNTKKNDSIDIFFKKKKNNVEILKKISKAFRFLFMTSRIFVKIHKLISKKEIADNK